MRNALLVVPFLALIVLKVYVLNEMVVLQFSFKLKLILASL